MDYDADILGRAKEVKLAVFDVDGVFTDGKISLHGNGSEHVAFNIRDGLGLVMLQKGGAEAAVISGRDSRIVRERMAYLNIRECHLGVADKRQALEGILRERSLQGQHICYAGDDLVDIEAMRVAGLAVAVADAHPLVKGAAHWITTSRGGDGAVREVCELLLAARGYGEDDLISWAGGKGAMS